MAGCRCRCGCRAAPPFGATQTLLLLAASALGATRSLSVFPPYRNREYARRMKEEWGKAVEFVVVDGADHGFFHRFPWSEHADEVVRVVRRFVVDHMDSSE